MSERKVLFWMASLTPVVFVLAVPSICHKLECLANHPPDRSSARVHIDSKHFDNNNTKKIIHPNWKFREALYISCEIDMDTLRYPVNMETYKY